MDSATFAALSDPTRLRIVELLARRPHAVGEIAMLLGIRQPQATKHLQTLSRAGLVTTHPLAQRRIYALSRKPLGELRRWLDGIGDADEVDAGALDVLERYRRAIEFETAEAAADPDWARGRTLTLEQAVPAPPDLVWEFWTDPDRLREWWGPDDFTVSACELDVRPGGTIAIEIQEGDGTRFRSAGRFDTVSRPHRLAFTLGVLDADGNVPLRAWYDVRLHGVRDGTRLVLDGEIVNATVGAATLVAGMRLGWQQSLAKLARAVGKAATSGGSTTGRGAAMTERRHAGTGERRVVANISMSLDGRVTGPGGEFDMGWVAAHAVSDTARAHGQSLYDSTTTVLLGRKNFEGFRGYWPAVAADESADPRDRGIGRWLNEVDKVVVSSTVQEPDWENARIVATDPANAVKELRQQRGGDILVLSSASVIRGLLAAGELDRLSIILCPEIAGGGTLLFEDGLPSSSWTLTSSMPTETGALCLIYDRKAR
jgi:uncharacterized protein YndB with AHSA1/START domain/dihydrofolate reductase/DNA-binding transcriptional ArsR family regulator